MKYLDSYIKENIYYPFKKKNKLTRIKLAELLKTSEQTLKRFEHYEGKLSLHCIEELLKITNKKIIFKKERACKYEYYY